VLSDPDYQKAEVTLVVGGNFRNYMNELICAFFHKADAEKSVEIKNSKEGYNPHIYESYYILTNKVNMISSETPWNLDVLIDGDISYNTYILLEEDLQKIAKID
jgi:hypothetical protein